MHQGPSGFGSKGVIGIMPSNIFSLLTIVSLLGVSQLGAANQEPATVVLKKEHLTEKDIMSPTFYTLEQVTGMGILGLRILYETSGAETFEEFAQALLTAQNLRLDRQLVLRSLYEKRSQRDYTGVRLHRGASQRSHRSGKRAAQVCPGSLGEAQLTLGGVFAFRLLLGGRLFTLFGSLCFPFPINQFDNGSLRRYRPCENLIGRCVCTHPCDRHSVEPRSQTACVPPISCE